MPCKCQSLARAARVEQRTAELLDCEYFSVVFTVSDVIAAVALQNKAVAYRLLFRATAERVVDADQRPLGMCECRDPWIAAGSSTFSKARSLSTYCDHRRAYWS